MIASIRYIVSNIPKWIRDTIRIILCDVKRHYIFNVALLKPFAEDMFNRDFAFGTSNNLRNCHAECEVEEIIVFKN